MKSIAQKVAGLFFFIAVFSPSVMAQTGQLPTQQGEQTEVSDEELESFAQAFQGMRMLNQQAQQQMAQLVQDEGMEIQRFNEIYQAEMDPAVEVDTTEEEEQQYENISSDIQEMQEGFQEQMEEMITDEGLTMERYEQIALQLEKDPELQERLRALFQG